MSKHDTSMWTMSVFFRETLRIKEYNRLIAYKRVICAPYRKPAFSSMSSHADAFAGKLASERTTSDANRAISDQANVEFDPLPVYAERTAARQPNQKKLEVTLDKDGKPLVSFMIYGHEALSTNVGTILEGSGPLRGVVRLDSDAPNPIRSIVLTVRGDYLMGASTNPEGEKNYTFFNHTETLWSQDYGKPDNSSTDSRVTLLRSAYKGQLQGEYTWPISVTLPKEVEFTPAHESAPRTFPLPHSFNERFIRATISYTASIKFNRFGFLKEDYELSQPFGYYRVTYPPPFPPLRDVAYQEGTPLLGPSIDPYGWHSQEPIHIKGRIFKSVDFIAQCTLYISKPLAYKAGSFIPLYIRIESDNEQALDLLANPKSIHVRVRRQIIDHTQKHNLADNGTFRESLDYSQRAVWWASTEEHPTLNSRFFNGELHLKPGMKPNTELGHFKLSYSVMLYDFSAIGLEFQEQKFLQEFPIEICTFYAPGPRPKSIMPHDCSPDVPFGKFIVPDMEAFSKGFY
ncbi:hypothetical protein HYPSUDRAFT_216949 [Hypholoma sublateritium FD-334 SS-4]|uniref:Arrestin-like N-terminal domain-containing protein n=1 Tax=Hypholoma sublateritium (strain FD-334 SS-4) TaxID=945553 RepID=A0A0D2MB16_HYPSF|nr:hypothetical protein HYPSUDRAFT_216949 [Hypholoma sublateritium FD-334 SS-4]